MIILYFDFALLESVVRKVFTIHFTHYYNVKSCLIIPD